MPSEDEGFSEAESSRLDKIERAQEEQASSLERLAAMVAKIVPSSHAEAQQRTEDRLDRPSSVQEQALAALEARDKKIAEDREKEETKAELADLRAKLTEVKPEPPESRATRLMWGSTRAR